MGCDAIFSIVDSGEVGFNPRTRVGCDERKRESFPADEMFQSTHPRGVRREQPVMRQRELSFNPRTRVGCDPSNILTNVAKERVSIHAPAWGATIKKSLPKTAYVGFNPRTRVGCDHSWVPLILTSSAFQSTHPRGVRHDLRAIEDLRHAVSIHAPAWGATQRVEVTQDYVLSFQSTHPRGVRRITSCTSRSAVRLFQSTHPRGVRPRWPHSR